MPRAAWARPRSHPRTGTPGPLQPPSTSELLAVRWQADPPFSGRASAALAIDRAPAWCSGISGHHQNPRNERTNTEVRAAGGAGGEAEAGRKSSLKHRAAEHGASRSLPIALASQVPHSLRAHGTSLG